MNKVILMGRLTRDPELSQTAGGTAVLRFSIAVNRRFAKEGQQTADFINCTAWRQQAEFISRYFRKGSMIAVVGNIQTRSWDGQDGKKQFATDVIVDEVYFTGSRSESGGSAAAPAYEGRSASDSHVQQAPQEDEFAAMGFSPADISEDDLPF